jgi:ABC-type amino acid transport substrate-binding protein
LTYREDRFILLIAVSERYILYKEDFMKYATMLAAAAACAVALSVSAQPATFEKVPIKIFSPKEQLMEKVPIQKTEKITPSPAGEDEPTQSERKTLRIISDFNSPPFSFKEGMKKKGFEMDLGEAIGKELGERVIWLEKDFSIPTYRANLDMGNADAAMASITITDKRKEDLAFTRPYFQTGFAVATSKDIDWKHNWFTTGLDKWRVGVVRGTTGEKWARENLGSEIKTYSSAERLMQTLRDFKLGERGGPGYCILHDQGILIWLLSQSSYRYQIVEKNIAPQYYGIAVSKKNGKLLADLNAALQKLNADGTYREIYQKWYAQAQDLPLFKK